MNQKDTAHPDPARAYVFGLEYVGIKLGLQQIRSLLDGLGRPDLAYQSVIVAGTNGKGSTTAMIERGLRAAGYRTGRYTSPHLVDIEERFAIDGQAITRADFDDAAGRIRAVSETLAHPPSFFEATTAIALDVFRAFGVDVAVLEVGLGGRLDATNAVDAVAAVITRVDVDHEAFLGSTIGAIAAEKAGVIKPGQIVVLADNPPDASLVVERAARERGATLVRSREGVRVDATVAEGQTTLDLETPRRRYEGVRLSLRGGHQIDNAVSAVRLFESIDAAGLVRVPADAVRTALEDVEWPGRLELIQTSRGAVLLDGAHNPSGAAALARYLRETYSRPLPLVLGVMADKDMAGIVGALAGSVSSIVATAAATPRAARPEDLAALVRRVVPQVPIRIEPEPARAVAHALADDRLVVVGGSLYLVGEVRAGL